MRNSHNIPEQAIAGSETSVIVGCFSLKRTAIENYNVRGAWLIVGVVPKPVICRDA